MMNKTILASELPLNADGSVYHLNILPEDMADTVILVGDPGRVETVSKFFDQVEIKKSKREFVTHTGTKNGKRLTVISSGIGTDNIDIVINELDALANVDLKNRQIKSEKKSLNFIRLGTSGSVNPNIDAGSFVKSKLSVGFDGLMKFYPAHQDASFKNEFLDKVPYENIKPLLYFTEGSQELFDKFSDGYVAGNTGSLSGFYGPQGREVRLKSLDNEFLDKLHACGLDNFEMETSAIYSFSNILGHKALSINLIIANRTTGNFLEDYHGLMDEMISKSLDVISTL
ncbi:phosphorylase [Flavobacteriaceae bacterium Ap0902]|nr:phosphorylase [Flavobacteriaceae bacterium Ap0902]